MGSRILVDTYFLIDYYKGLLELDHNGVYCISENNGI